MIITENKNYFTGEISYQILIKPEDDLEPEDLAECFKEQYPNKLCVICFSRIVKMECGLILIGLKMPRKRKERK